MSDAILRTETPRRRAFFGWRVVAAASVLAAFGWGVGFYGSPVYLHAVLRDAGEAAAALVQALAISPFSPAAAVLDGHLPAASL